MPQSVVALVRCESYDDTAVCAAVAKGIALLEGAQAFAHAGEKIVFKPNVLSSSDPSDAAIAHPAVVGGIFSAFAGLGATLSFGDSPAVESCAGALTRSGYMPYAEKYGVAVADFDAGQDVANPHGVVHRTLHLANGICDADGVISIAKLKTHGLIRYTGAIKNQFGCIPGIRKGQYHARIPNVFDFCQMLVDINVKVRPRLFVIDGIVGMEGNGPRNGDPRPLNVLLFSTDPIALDTIAATIINLDPAFVPTIALGVSAHLGTSDLHEIDIVGDSLDSFKCPTFNVQRKPPLSVSSINPIFGAIKSRIIPRPTIVAARCTACGTCVKACPVEPKALAFAKGGKPRVPPRYNYARCIRCYCCQETCPARAIKIYEPLGSRLLPLFVKFWIGLEGLRIFRSKKKR